MFVFRLDLMSFLSFDKNRISKLDVNATFRSSLCSSGDA